MIRRVGGECVEVVNTCWCGAAWISQASIRRTDGTDVREIQHGSVKLWERLRKRHAKATTATSNVEKLFALL